MDKQSLLLQEFPGLAIIAGKREVTFSEMLQRITIFSNQCPKDPQAKSVIFCENREAWIYALFGVLQSGGIVVPVDVMSTVHDVAYVLTDCAPKAIWTSVKKLDIIKEALLEAQMDIPVLMVEDYETSPIPQYTPKSYVPYQLKSTAIIPYTSGTTGSPKGVMLSYENMIDNVHSVSVDVPIFRPELRTLILLPLHHVLPLLGSVFAPMMTGGGVAIAPSMAPADIMDTLVRGKIGIIIGVPRLWQTLFKGIKRKIDASPITRFLFWMCSKVKSRTLSRFVFQSVRKKMGGNITYCVSGGAALDKVIGEGMRTIGLDVLEGYGMSEAAPMISFTRPGDIIPGCAGKGLPRIQLKLVNGELCAKGANIMQGYYNRPEETAQVIDEEGFLHTGDLAKFDADGRVYITGRCKEIIVLSNGKNINPTEIEFKLEKYDAYIKEVAVMQDGDMLKAIIVPQPDLLSSTDAEIEELLKQNVLQPYNQEVAPYKKIMSLYVLRGELPRTRLDKIQRFRLPSLLINDYSKESSKAEQIVEPSYPEYHLIKEYIQSEKKCVVHPTDHLETDLAFDSLDKVSFQAFLEMTFGIHLEQERLSSFKNVTELAEYVVDFKSFVGQEKIDWHVALNQSTDHLKLPATWRSIIVISWFIKALCKCYFHISIKGKDNIPQSGPYILAPNHQSFLDGALVLCFLKNKIIRSSYFYAKADHVQNPVVKMIAKCHNVIIMHTSNFKYSIMQLAEVLKQGKNIVIFPEGTRTNDGKLGEFKKTFSILSKELNVPIVPVSISGAYEVFPKGTKFPRPGKVTITYLPPIYPQMESSYDDLVQQTQSVISAQLKG